MSVRIFNNENLQRQFDENGFVVLPFLDAEQVRQLNQLYSELNIQANSFHSSSFFTDVSVKKKINEIGEQIFQEKVSATFRDIKKLGCSFLTKPVGESGRMPVHQDWTVVDETKYYSVTIWTALQDVNEENGAMRVLPRSHRFTNTLRAPTLPSEYSEVQETILNAMQTVSLKAGEALIFNHALLHASFDNLSEKPRLAFTYGLIPKEASLFLYHKNEKGLLEKYAMPDDMFTTYTHIGQRPEMGQKNEEVAYSVTSIDSQRLNYYLSKKNWSTMKPIFKAEEHQAFFEREGYLVLPLLSESEINDLKQYYESLQLKDENGFGFHVSMDQKKEGLSAQIREKIWSVILPKLGNYLKDFKPFVASFVVKEPNPKGVVPAHQDWTFADGEEEGYCSITTWTALVDTAIENGGMGVIRGSHKLMQNHRPSPSPQTPVPLSAHMFSIFPYLKTLDMKAGEVLFFDNRTFHASPPNTTTEVRLAAGVGVTQKDAELIHYTLKPDGKKSTLLKYKVDEDFFLKYNNARLARMYDAGETIQDYEAVGEEPYHFPNYSSDELIALIKEAGNEYNVPMCETLAKLFNYNMDGSQKTSESAPQMVDTSASSATKNEQEEWVWVDDRTFLQKYTPLNILREVKRRVFA